MPLCPALAPVLFSVTKEGHLLFQHFQAGDSGKYSCTIFYTKHGIPVSQTFYYNIFGESSTMLTKWGGQPNKGRKGGEEDWDHTQLSG